jgi:hypothetical protein
MDGAVDLSFEWLWAGDETTIDGFLIYLHTSDSPAAYAFGTDVTTETVHAVPANKRAFVKFGAAANKYYTFGVAAQKTTLGTGLIRSTVVKSLTAGENPYRPSSTVAFNGNVLGTIDGVSASAVVNDLNAVVGGTTLYRSLGAPTFNPTPSGVTLASNTNGTSNITLYWDAYNQGALPADLLILFWRKSVGAPTISDSSLAFKINTLTGGSHTFEGVDPVGPWSFGSAAARKTENGL